MQHEIKQVIPLLDEKGNLTEPGYAKKLLPIYRRSEVKAGKLRLKEWDYYLIANEHYAVALTIADNGYMGLDSISFIHFDEKWEKTVSPMRFMPLGKTCLPESSVMGDCVISGRHYALTFAHDKAERKLFFHMDRFLSGKPLSGKLTLSAAPAESMVICTPFDKPGHFYYNQKINCLRASGTVTVGGKDYVFEPGTAFGVLDWGRGVWTYHNTWYWSSASGLADGVPFGFNLGYGFGNTEAASENMLFYNGRAHKLGQVVFQIPQLEGKDNYLAPWRFTDDENRLELDFLPILDRASCTDIKLIKSDQHQVFGRFSGRAVLDDGTVIQIKELIGFAEKVENKW